LLVAVSSEGVERMLDALGKAGLKQAAVIGRLEAGEPGHIRVSRIRQPEMRENQDEA
jgi:hydrogenase maturation factor